MRAPQAQKATNAKALRQKQALDLGLESKLIN